MAVYPFYISADAEGRRSEIKGGTRRADGCMTTTCTKEVRVLLQNPTLYVRGLCIVITNTI